MQTLRTWRRSDRWWFWRLLGIALVVGIGGYVTFIFAVVLYRIFG